VLTACGYPITERDLVRRRHERSRNARHHRA
jgi:hypothetical protein